MTLDEFNKKKSQIPETPGVYFFLGAPSRKGGVRSGKILYIGKAAILRDRVRSYFSPDLMDGRGERIVHMVEQAKSIEWRETDSVLEALILESSLIKTHKPGYNSISKDDKSFNFVVITKETFPRILLVRGKELEERARGSAATEGSQSRTPGMIFGPFPHGLQLRIAMKIIRRIFPYRDEKCTSCAEQLRQRAQGIRHKVCKPCFNRQIGLCPGVCTGEISQKEYRRTIRHIKLFFQGKKKILIRELEREMKMAAREERFEMAHMYKRQIFALRHIQDVALIRDEYRVPLADRRKESSGAARRIEAYDSAHLRGQAAYGVMVVVENGEPQKAEYRLFRIRSAKAGDDPGALREVLSRRFAHTEWPMPRLIAVDGARAQMSAAEKILTGFGAKIPIVGVVKDAHHRPCEVRAGANASKDMIQSYEREILLANAEAHRFAISQHRKTMRGSLIGRPAKRGGGA